MRGKRSPSGHRRRRSCALGLVSLATVAASGCCSMAEALDQNPGDPPDEVKEFFYAIADLGCQIDEVFADDDEDGGDASD